MQQLLAKADAGRWPDNSDYPQLEMREIEHSLCEFDKYERARLGKGTLRAKYHPSKRSESYCRAPGPRDGGFLVTIGSDGVNDPCRCGHGNR